MSRARDACQYPDGGVEPLGSRFAGRAARVDAAISLAMMLPFLATAAWAATRRERTG